MKTKKTTIENRHADRAKKQLFLLMILIFIIPVIFETTNLFAQSEFKAEYQKQEVYYDSLIQVLGLDSMQGTGYKQYQRWYRYWAPKLSSNYDYEDYQSDLLDYANNYTSPQGYSSGPNWKLIGPNDDPFSGFAARGTGQIHYIYRDPNDENMKTIYACSPVGGLFKTTDNGETWFNLGTDKGLPRSGVSSVVVDSRSSSTLYITTGNGEGFAGEKIWQTAIGVWRTQDNGGHWENIGLGTDNNGDFVYHMRKVIETSNINDSTHLIVTTTKGLYRSRNANKSAPTWDTLVVGEFYDVVQDPMHSNIIYASGSNSTGIYKYDLNTNTETKIFDIDTVDFPYDTIKRPDLRRISLKIPKAPQATGYLYAVLSMRDYDHTSIYRYDIDSGNWHKFLGAPFRNGYARKLGWAIRPQLNDSNQIQILGRDAWPPLNVFYNGLSNDDSTKYRRVRKSSGVGVHDDFHYIMIDDDNSTIWVGSDGGVSKGTFINDTLIQWSSKNNGLGVATIEFIDAKYGYVSSGQFDCGSYVYKTDDEINWEVNYKNGGDGFQNIIDSSNVYYLSAQEGRIGKWVSDVEKTFPDIGEYPKRDTACELTGKDDWSSIFSTYYVKVGNRMYAAGQNEIMTYGYRGNPTKWINWSNLDTLIGCARSGTWRVAAADNNGTHQIYASAYGEQGAYQHMYKSIGGGGPNYWTKVYNTPTEGWIGAIEITSNTDSVLVSVGSKIYSVNTTSPSSPNWHDLTFNLDAGTINNIYRYSSKTWLATERGVYYLIPGTTSWVNYTTNLPNCEVKDIKVQDKRVYVGTYGRGVWFASTPSCGNIGGDHIIGPDEVVYEAETDTYFGDVIVETGNTYTVKGTLEMAANCRIIVERGAKLIIDGGTITNACPDFWQGIELHGNSNAAQVPVNQGWVTLKNGATIEYAKQAIATIKFDTTFVDMRYTGGVIQADSSFFKNNIESVVFFPYPTAYPTFAVTANKSYFKNCVFSYDSNYYYFNENPISHVNLNDVWGVLFQSNLFENRVTRDFANDEHRGIGISSWNAGFIASTYEGAVYGNVFDSLQYGIKAYAYSGNDYFINLDGNIFNSNLTGCYLGAENFATVTNNLFNVEALNDDYFPFVDSVYYTGLYLDNCTGYQIEENEFYSSYDPIYDPPGEYKNIGAYINNSGPGDNFIYNNDFHNLHFATIAQGINKGKGGTGLTIKCNDYTDNFQDISVLSSQQGDEFGIKYYQGSNAEELSAPASNTFSHINGNNIESDYNNECADITYWHHLQNIPPNGIYVIPVFADSAPEITKTPNPLNIYYNKSTACSSNLVTRLKSTIKENIATNNSYEEIFADSLNILVDDGNSTALNLDISTSMPPETMELRGELLDASPYLSDTVMVNAAEKEDVLPNSIITEVLTANPQSAKSEKVLDKLDERDTPPNANQMSQILANDTVIGHKESLEGKHAYYAGEKARSVYELTRYYMCDTALTAVHDSITAALANINSLTSRYLQAFCYLNANDSLEAVGVLSNIPMEFDLLETESDYHNYFVDYIDVMFAFQKGRTLDSTQIVEVYDVMDNTDGLLDAYARNLLIMTDGLEYNEPYLFPDTSANKSSKVKYHDAYTDFWDDEESYFKLYPNPAGGYITLEYKLDQAVTRPVVEIVTADGVHINTFLLFNHSSIKIIDLRKWTSGTYLLRLIDNGKTLQNEKFIKY